jgi:uncharacterized protein (TIGR00661 family)
MKILYALQGTGNGHVSRARDIIPLLQKKCHTDILISGTQADISLPFEVNYRLKGFSFIFGKKGGVDIWNTYIQANAKRLRDEIASLPVMDYDFVINDFEPVSAWACLIRKIPCIALSHQAALLEKNAPRPSKKDPLGRFILNNYAPASARFGFHFGRYGKNVFTPVIRKEVRDIIPVDQDYYTVYLPAFSNEALIDRLRNFPDVRWVVYSKHTRKDTYHANIEIHPVTNEAFLSSMAGCTGILCGAGFETPAEALFLGKKLLVVPMANQYEQQCNAASLKELGVPVIKKFNEKSYHHIQEWLNSDLKIQINYPDQTEWIINKIFEMQVKQVLKKNKWQKDYVLTYHKGKEKKRRKFGIKFFSKPAKHDIETS